MCCFAERRGSFYPVCHTRLRVAFPDHWLGAESGALPPVQEEVCVRLNNDERQLFGPHRPTRVLSSILDILQRALDGAPNLEILRLAQGLRWSAWDGLCTDKTIVAC